MRLNRHPAYRLAVPLVGEYLAGQGTASPFLAPLTQCDHDRGQLLPLFRQAIFDLAPVALHRLTQHDPILDQPRKPVRQNVARNAERRLKILKMPDARQCAAQDEKRPALAHRFQRTGERALFQILRQIMFHRPSR